MKPIQPTQSSNPNGFASGNIADLADAVARQRAGDAALPLMPREADLTNVVPFPRGGRQGAEHALQRIALSSADRPAVLRPSANQRARWIVCLLCSIAAHAALYLPFGREPDPMASIGLEMITVDIVLGADQAAGVATQPTESESPVTDVAENVSDPVTEPAKVEPDVALEQPTQSKQVQEEPKPFDTAAAEPAVEPPSVEPPPVPQQEEPPADRTPLRQMAALPLPAEPPPLEIWREPPHQPAPAVQPSKDVAKPVSNKPQQRPKEPERQQTAPPKRDTRQAKLTDGKQQRSTAASTSASGGVGRGSSSTNSNYRGLVAAHLARYKQFPADARARGEQGSATVTFMLDGGGRVTSVSLARGAGVASLDREAVAMVRRASPFPPPPDGRGLSFTAPVSFRLQ